VFGKFLTQTTIVLLTVLAVAVVAGWPSVPASSAAESGRCDRFAAPWGSDRGSGTRSHPYRTPGKLARSLGPGQTGCLRGGTYRFSQLVLTRPRITLRPYTSKRVKLRGAIKVKPSARGSAILGMTLSGRGGESSIGPKIYADRVVLRGNVITNGHTSTCVHVSRFYSDPAPRGVVIKRNLIHDCGELPSNNKNHGIYIAEAHGTIVRDNWIYDNADRGIQLYPDADGSKVVGNVIAGNGDGMVINGSGSAVTDQNTITGNVIAGSYRGYNVYSGDSGPVGRGNMLRDNCVWAGNAESPYDEMGGVMTPARNYTARANLIAPPRFVNSANDNYRLHAGSECRAKYTGTMATPGGG
jgi:parallel beta-helix repeat protein